MRKTLLPANPAPRSGICCAAVASLVCLPFVVAPAAHAAAHHLPTGPDAFLRYQVDSTAELEAELRSNPAALQRYSRHFGVSPQRFLTFVHNALVIYRLPEARVVTVYGVTRTGRIYSVRERLRQGSRVWATRSGQPILKWACANPLVGSLPGTKLARAPRTARPPHAAPPPAVASSNELAPFPPAEVAAPEVPAEAFSLETPTAAASTGLTVPVPVLGGAGASIPAAIASAAGGHGGAFLVPVGLLLGAALGHGGGTGSAASLSTVPSQPELPPVAAPEPGTLALAAAGACVPLAGLLRRRRVRSRRAGG